MTNSKMLLNNSDRSIVGLVKEPRATASDLWLSTRPGAMLPGGAVLSKDAPPVKLETEEEKKLRRVMSNRRSAKESRHRRRRLLKELEQRADILATENRSMARANAELCRQMQLLRQQLMQVLAATRGRQQHQQPPLLDENTFSDYFRMKRQTDEPYQLTSMAKSESLEPLNLQDTSSLWNSNDVWDPLLSAH